MIRVALAGNPNSGKTTMFNALTGANEKVGNWAGVTVEAKTHTVRKSLCPECKELLVVDLPGAYSMSPFTSEESVTHEYIKNENPDVIINIVDATNLSRSLFFTTQLLELGIPVVVALNKSDINEKKETKINVTALSEKLGCPVVETVSVSSDGLKVVVETAVASVGKSQTAPYKQGNVNLENRESVKTADKKRFDFVNSIVKTVENRKSFTRNVSVSDKIDNILTNKWLGIPIFAAVMWLVFQISQVWVGEPIANLLVKVLEIFQGWVGGLLVNASPFVSALLVDGIIGGVIAVIGFLPLVMVMYFLIAILEDCGYMSRVAVVLDPIFKKAGLSGKSVIPFVISIGCAVPGVMASRTIRNERERRAAALLTPFMPCGAKIPVIALIAGAFFDKAGWVSTVMYISGILLIFVCALLINSITGNRAKKSYFIIEMPDYRFPTLSGAFRSMCSRGWEYIVKAATIILVCNTAVQVMQTFTWKLEVAETADTSILASVAGVFSYFLLPVIGFLSWQLAAATVTGFIAKENVVGTLAVCFGVTSLTSEMMGLSEPAALAFLMFNLFSPPCFAAIGAMNAEMKSTKWLLGGIGLQLGVGFTVGYLVNTIGTLVVDSSKLNKGAAVAGAVMVVVFGVILSLLINNTNKKIKAEKLLKSKKV